MSKKNILIAIDDPDWSGIIVYTLLNFIKKENVKIILLNVLETTLAEEELFYNQPEKFIDREAQKAKFAYIENFFEKNEIEYTFLFEEGDAAEHIINTAKNLNINLVVVGSHNKKLFERLLLGSVAYKVMRLSPCSVMVISSKYHIHDTLGKPFNVLLAISDEDSSLGLIQKIPELIDTKRVGLHIINATRLTRDIIPPEAQMYINVEEIDKETKIASEELLEKISKLFESQEFITIKKASLIGKPAHVIIDYAQKNNIDLIIMGAHTRKELADYLLGSTSAKVGETAEIPVLIIKK